MDTDQELEEALAFQREAVAWSRKVAEESQVIALRGVEAHERIATALEKLLALLEEEKLS